MPSSGALSWNTRTLMRAVGSGSLATVTVTAVWPASISAPLLL